MSRPVKSLLHPKLSAICEASPRRRHPTVSMSHRTNASTRLPSARLLRWARCARCMGLVVMWLAVVVGYPMATWGGEEEKQPLKLPEVVILGQSRAERLWPGQDPIGRRMLSYGAPEDGKEPGWQTVVGVVEDARDREVETPRFDLYLPYRQAPNQVKHFMVRLSGDPIATVPALATADEFSTASK